MILLVLDYCTVSGSNGTHPCFVTMPARCSLVDTKKSSHSRKRNLFSQTLGQLSAQRRYQDSGPTLSLGIQPPDARFG
ncbi:hypothetical protein F4823DRAFT_584683 [Ustulina deusta]|nr:hypothetical protein F4823DRAFT_584683 [Ustulina deusta]